MESCESKLSSVATDFPTYEPSTNWPTLTPTDADLTNIGLMPSYEPSPTNGDIGSTTLLLSLQLPWRKIWQRMCIPPPTNMMMRIYTRRGYG